MATATFQEFLKELEAREKKPDVLARRKEWVDAVDRLLTRIEDWLKELDPAGVFEVHRRPVERSEAGLGRYVATSLVIAVGDAKAEVVPIGRVGGGPVLPARAVGVGGGPHLPGGMREMRASGRVDVTNRLVRRSIYRDFTLSGDEVWLLHTAENVPTLAIFGRDQLADALRDVFS